MNEQLKLSELNTLVKKAVDEAFSAPIWVIGEISELKTNRSGHCYLSLIEKDENSDAIIAQARATIWSYTFRMLQPFFESSTGQQLTEGIKVLVSVSVEFHELYGYSLNIRDIDPTYTLGDMARRRREIVARLKGEGVADMNKELELPLVPQKIAIISSPTAAGYQDFIEQLTHNQAGYRFDFKLFPAIMQGNQAESSIVGALDQIYLYEKYFDVVVIIRGGGSQADLSCFDNYNLAYYITQFPLPVITGIGHEKDDTIVDFVAHTRLKTPTAVAEFLISGVARFDLRLDELKSRFLESITDLVADLENEMEQIVRVLAPAVNERLHKSNHYLSQTIWKLERSARSFIKDNDNRLNRKEASLKHEFKSFTGNQLLRLEKMARSLSGILRQITSARHDQLTRKIQRSESLIGGVLLNRRHHLELSLQKAMLTDPIKILARGYSITTYNGRALKDAEMVTASDLIETRLFNGRIISEVKTTNKRFKNEH